MKMNATLFWGILLILIGLSLILKIVFNVEFSIFRVIIAFLLIYFGIKLFIGKDFSLFPNSNKDSEVVFSEKTIKKVEDGKEYNVIFGGSKFDLREMTFPDSVTIHIKINTIFGGTQVLVNHDVPIHINSNTVFAGTKMPDGNTSSFGSLAFENDTAKRGKAKLIIETNTIFGGLHVK
jgi:predicted membrane protein